MVVLNPTLHSHPGLLSHTRVHLALGTHIPTLYPLTLHLSQDAHLSLLPSYKPACIRAPPDTLFSYNGAYRSAFAYLWAGSRWKSECRSHHTRTGWAGPISNANFLCQSLPSTASLLLLPFSSVMFTHRTHRYKQLLPSTLCFSDFWRFLYSLTSLIPINPSKLFLTALWNAFYPVMSVLYLSMCTWKNSFIISAQLRNGSLCHVFWHSLTVLFRSMLYCNNFFSTSTCALYEAICNSLFPNLTMLLTSTPHLINSLTISTCP